MNSALESDLKNRENLRSNTRHHVCLPYNVVREHIKNFGFQTVAEYQNWLRDQRTKGKYFDFPLQPQSLYVRRNEWISTKHFLGKTEDTTPTGRARNITPQQPKRVGWRIIAQIFGLGKNLN